MLLRGVDIAVALGEPPAEEMAGVHQASASVAYGHLFGSPFPLDEARQRWAAPGREVWPARRGRVLVGFAAARGEFLDGLYVTPQESGRGVGTALLGALPAVTRLWVLADNGPGRRFYERRGWRNSGETQEDYGNTDLLYVRERP